MKKFKTLAMATVMSCLLLLASTAGANTVNIFFEGMESSFPGGFDLFFVRDATYGFPVQNIVGVTDVYAEEFSYEIGGALPYGGNLWFIETYVEEVILPPSGVYPLETKVDLARGIYAQDDLGGNTLNALSDGLVLTMNSVATLFAVDIYHPKTVVYDVFYADINDFTITEEWVGDVQNVTIAGSPVPIPGAIWLLGTGLLGLVGIRRKKS